jgi:hypothetical protein
MKLLLFLFLAFTPISLISNINQTTNYHREKNNIVYICKGPKSERYHRISNCSGLSSCSTEIHRIHINQAVKIGRTPCKICY